MQRRTLRVGAFVFQTVYSQWERGGGEQARAPRVGEGNGQPLSSYQSEGKGAWGRYDPPPRFHSSLGGTGAWSQVRRDPFGGLRVG